MEGYDYAYRILSVYNLEQPILLKDMIAKHRMKCAQRGPICLPQSIKEELVWHRQKERKYGLQALS